MGLDEYRKKRNFKKTGEPEGELAKKKGRQFVIQKHAARRLHYDLRLELNGVLKSWAVPKGPSLDPSKKRLAIHVEDHPLEYGSFEGIIPAGEYGAGTVMVWDQGEWEPENDPEEGYAKGNLKFQLSGKKLKGRWALVRLNKAENDWLLIKEKDKEAKKDQGEILCQKSESVLTGRTLAEIAQDQKADKLALFNPSQIPGAIKKVQPQNMHPQLATLVKEAPREDDWLHEIKYDGYRMLAFYQKGNVKLVSRNGKEWSDKFPLLLKKLQELPIQEAIFDGEVVVLDEQGRSDFQALQNHLKNHGFQELVYYVFDLPWYNGYDLTKVPLVKRKEILRGLIKEANQDIRFSEHIQGHGEIVYEKACQMGLEGIVSKHELSGYEQKRSRGWAKVKCGKRQEFIICGFTSPSGTRFGFGSLLLGYYQDNLLMFAGKVGTGFTNKTLQELYKRLVSLRREESPYDEDIREKKGVYWAKPCLVAEIAFTEWTDEGVLRHPSFLGLREDKDPKLVIKEKESRMIGLSEQKEKVSSDIISGIKLTNPENIIYQDLQKTKWEVATFYERIAPYLLPHLINRPLSVIRCPQGAHNKCFYQKHVTESLPDVILAATVTKEDKSSEYIMIKDLVGLIALVQLRTLEFHPWGAKVDKIEQPDRMIFDLDPGLDVPISEIVAGAFSLRNLLEEWGLKSYVKTSGGKGYHLVVPLKRRADWEEVKAFSRAVAAEMVRRNPDKFIATASKAKRKGKIFIDYLRNSRGATAVAAYSLRAFRGAPVSTPIRWDELSTKFTPQYYTMENLEEHLKKGDPWEGFFGIQQLITVKMKKKAGLKV